MSWTHWYFHRNTSRPALPVREKLWFSKFGLSFKIGLVKWINWNKRRGACDYHVWAFWEGRGRRCKPARRNRGWGNQVEGDLVLLLYPRTSFEASPYPTCHSRKPPITKTKTGTSANLWVSLSSSSHLRHPLGFRFTDLVAGGGWGWR